MKVILRESVNNQGSAGDIIDVKPGFARNFLIPKGLAYLATDANIQVFNREKVQKAKKIEQQRIEAEKVKSELEKISLTAVVKVGEDGKLFGSVSSHVVAELLKEKGFEISHRKIFIDETIKELGVYEAQIEVMHEVMATVKVWVVKE